MDSFCIFFFLIYLFIYFPPMVSSAKPSLNIQYLRKSEWLSNPEMRIAIILKTCIIFPVFCVAGCADSIQYKQSSCLWLRLRCWDNCVIFKCTVLVNATGKPVISSAVHRCSFDWLKWMKSILCSTLDCGWNGGGMSTTTTDHVTLRSGQDFKI